MKNKYLIFSHYPRERSTSPSTTVYSVFLAAKSAYPNADHIFIKLPEEKFRSELSNKTDENVVLLFNGCGSIMHENAIYAIDYAKRRNLPVVVYWHETAWSLNNFAASNPKHWTKLEKLLQQNHVKHWVPFSQGKQLIMYIFKKSYEDVLIVHEAIDLEKYLPPTCTNNKEENIQIVGSGVISLGDIVWRKGVDYFCKISEKLSQIDGVDCNYYWFGGAREDVSKVKINIPENCNFLGFVEDFYNKLPTYNIFLLTSRDDPSPIVVFEALACNLPVFCFDSVGTKEMLPNEFVASDVYEMVDNITNYWNNRHKYPPNYFRKIAEKYSTTSFVERIHRNKELLTVEETSLNHNLNQSSLKQKDLLKLIRASLKNSRLYKAASKKMSNLKLNLK